MRTLGTFGLTYRKTQGIPQRWASVSRMVTPAQLLQRRLDDDIEKVFHRACVARDYQIAADLLAVLEDRRKRIPSFLPRERRIAEAALHRARRAMERLNRLNGAQPAGG